MMIMGVDYHPSFQQIAFFVEETGECGERQLNHSDGEAEKFYRELAARGVSVRVGDERSYRTPFRTPQRRCRVRLPHTEARVPSAQVAA